MILRLVLGMLLIVIAGTAVSWAAVRVVDGVSDLLARRKDTYDPRFAEAPDSVDQTFRQAGAAFGFRSVDEEIEDLVTRYRRGEPIESGAPKEQT